MVTFIIAYLVKEFILIQLSSETLKLHLNTLIKTIGSFKGRYEQNKQLNTSWQRQFEDKIRFVK